MIDNSRPLKIGDRVIAVDSYNDYKPTGVIGHVETIVDKCSPKFWWAVIRLDTGGIVHENVAELMHVAPIEIPEEPTIFDSVEPKEKVKTGSSGCMHLAWVCNGIRLLIS